MDSFKQPKPQQSKINFNAFGRKFSPENYLYTMATEGISHHFGQSAEDVTVLRLFNKLRNGFYVDIGAFHPRKYSNTYALHQYYDWKGINIDASKEAISLFDLERPNDINIHTAVGNIEGKKTYWKFDFPARNTISLINVERQLEKGARIIGQEVVAIRPLSQILKRHLPKGKRIDLLNLDVEGVEIQVLKSNDWEEYRPKVLLVEDYSVQKEGLGSSEIHKYLVEHRYKFFSHTFDTTIYIDTDPLNSIEFNLGRKEHEAIKTKLLFTESTISRANHISSAIVKSLESKMNDQKKKHLGKIERLELKKDELNLKVKELDKGIKNLEKEKEELNTSNKNLVSINVKQTELLNQATEQKKQFSVLLEQQKTINEKLLTFISYTKQAEELQTAKEKFQYVSRTNKEVEFKIKNITKKIKKTRSKNRSIKRAKNRYKQLYKEVLKSRSWRYTSFFRKIFNYFRKA